MQVKQKKKSEKDQKQVSDRLLLVDEAGRGVVKSKETIEEEVT